MNYETINIFPSDGNRSSLHAANSQGLAWLWQGVTTNVIAILLVLIIGSLIFWLSRRRQVVKFFHIGRSGAVFFSARIDVIPFGSRGIDGLPRSFQGPSMPENEMKALAKLEEFLVSLRPLSQNIAGHLHFLTLRWRDVQLRAEISPDSLDNLERRATIFCLGSPAYNIVSQYIEDRFPGGGRFNDSYSSLVMKDSETFDGTDFFMVRRCVDINTEQRFFYTASTSALGTEQALTYLLDHWRNLQKQFGDDSQFTLVIKREGGALQVPRVVYQSID